MKSADIRDKFIQYFAQREHKIVESSSLVPENDPTLLFTNAGMVPFKETFLGEEKRNYQRAVSAQKCVRAGGKHNDLENVGHTARHHTFFEMLGNFSFGDYFKREAIQYAWDFLTNILNLPPEKLWITVYQEDQEAEDIWLKEMKIAPERFSRCGEADNFWSMGDIGPCGPCSEIFYDHGPQIAGGPPGSPEQDGDRYVEIWNLVFMQFNRDSSGNLTALPKPSVDTGMGLERIAAVMQGVHSNYETDTFQTLIRAAAKATHTDNIQHHSLKVIADHIRSCAFLISDGVSPSNEGRGYVLRRIIRRAIRHGILLGQKDIFFSKLVTSLVETMGIAYPELKTNQSKIESTLQQEEEQFSQTLNQGLNLLDSAITTLSDKTIPGDLLFKLYDTYGFPLDLIRDIAQEKNLKLDEVGFENAMTEQRKRARSASQFKVEQKTQLPDGFSYQSTFSGYTSLQEDSQVVALIIDGQHQDSIAPGIEACIVLDRTPFYAESGGQVGDQGIIHCHNAQFIVVDTQKKGDTILHLGHLQTGQLNVKDKVTASVDQCLRQKTIRNHTATHLLHAALRTVLGNQVIQKGSLVHPDYLRFDFAYDKPVKPDELTTIEEIVNQEILNNLSATTEEMPLDAAKNSGALGLFEDKYGQAVRVLSIGDFSKELCGGTHVSHSGDIGLFKITAESGIASGIRRIEAITGHTAREYLNQRANLVEIITQKLKTDPELIPEKIDQIIQANKTLEKQIQQIKSQNALSAIDQLIEQTQLINDIHVLAHEVDNIDTKLLRDLSDQLKNKLGTAIILLATVSDNKVQCVASVSKDLINDYHAGKLMQFFTKQIDGSGGGRADMAQGGGRPNRLTSALNSVYEWVKNNQ